MKKAFLFFIMIFAGVTISVNAQNNGFYHTVVWRDTLMDISLKYQVDLDKLAEVNGISNWNRIYIGQKLWILKAMPSGSDMVNVYIYHVKWGDTLSKLAENFNVTIWDIASLNQIYNLNSIYIGQKLYIPVKWLLKIGSLISDFNPQFCSISILIFLFGQGNGNSDHSIFQKESFKRCRTM